MGMEPFAGASADTFAPLIASIPDSVDTMRQAIAFKVGIAAKQAQAAQDQAQAEAISEKVNRARQFKKDLEGVQGNPDANAVASLIMKYPEFGDQLKQGWDVKDNAAKTADLTQTGEIYSAAASGNWELAGKQAQARLDADKAAGHADEGDQAIVDQITAAAGGDEKAKKSVLTMLGLHLAAGTGPEHFATVYGALKGGYTLDAGATRYDESGNVVAQSPFIKGADGTIYQRDDTPGTGAAPAGGSTTPGAATGAPPDILDDNGKLDPIKFYKNVVIPKFEGTKTVIDLNGKPVKYGINQGANPDLKVDDLTPDSAAERFKSKYWDESGAAKLSPALAAIHADTYFINPQRAQAFLAKAGGDPNKYMAMRENWMQSLAAKDPKKYGPVMAGWANRNSQLRDLAGELAGTDPPKPYYAPDASTAPQTASADGNAPPGYRVLIPGKQKDAPTGFRWSADGKSLEAIPGGPAEQDSLDPQSVTFFAQQYLTTGTLPTLGMGKAAAQMRQQILKEAAHQAGAEGLSGKDLAIQMAHYKANVTNVTNLEKQFGTIQANEQTAIANGQQFLDRSKELKTGKGDYRLLNAATQSYLRHTGDPTISAMDAAATTFATEYARVIAGTPSGGGTLSDSARQESMNIMRGDFPIQQKLSTYQQMLADMHNRIAAFHGTIQQTYKHLGDRAPELTGGGSDALPKGAKVVGTYHGKRVIEVNGKRMVEQ